MLICHRKGSKEYTPPRKLFFTFIIPYSSCHASEQIGVAHSLPGWHNFTIIDGNTEDCLLKIKDSTLWSVLL